jgi:hypothetical protein
VNIFGLGLISCGFDSIGLYVGIEPGSWVFFVIDVEQLHSTIIITRLDLDAVCDLLRLRT